MLTEKTLKTDIFSAITFTSGLIFLLLFYFMNESLLIWISIPFGLSLFVFFFLKNAFCIRKKFFIFLAILTYVSSMLVNLGSMSFEGILFLPHFLSSVGFAMFLFSGFIRPKFIDLLFFGLAFYVLVTFLSIGHMESAFVGSQNRVNTLFLFLFTFKFLVEYIRHGQVAMTATAFAQIITMTLFAALSGHVMGLLCSILLLVVFVACLENQLRKPILLSALAATAFGFMLYLFLDFFGTFNSKLFSDLFNFFNAFAEIIAEANFIHIKENLRIDIWVSFLTQLDIFGMIFGMPLNIRLFHDETFHNSFLLLSCRGGVFGMALSAFIVVACFKLFLRSPLLGSMFGILITRALTDTIFFAGSTFDFVVVAFVFLAFRPLGSFEYDLAISKVEK